MTVGPFDCVTAHGAYDYVDEVCRCDPGFGGARCEVNWAEAYLDRNEYAYVWTWMIFVFVWLGIFLGMTRFKRGLEESSASKLVATMLSESMFGLRERLDYQRKQFMKQKKKVEKHFQKLDEETKKKVQHLRDLAIEHAHQNQIAHEDLLANVTGGPARPPSLDPSLEFDSDSDNDLGLGSPTKNRPVARAENPETLQEAKKNNLLLHAMARRQVDDRNVLFRWMYIGFALVVLLLTLQASNMLNDRALRGDVDQLKEIYRFEGLKGQNGTDGADGTNGVDGEKGDQGDQGEQGPPGQDAHLEAIDILGSAEAPSISYEIDYLSSGYYFANDSDSTWVFVSDNSTVLSYSRANVSMEVELFLSGVSVNDTLDSLSVHITALQAEVDEFNDALANLTGADLSELESILTAAEQNVIDSLANLATETGVVKVADWTLLINQSTFVTANLDTPELVVGGDINATGNIEADTFTGIHMVLSVKLTTVDLEVTGDATLSTLTATGAADFGSTVNVTGKLTAESAFECWGPAEMGAASVTTFTSSGAADFGGTVNVTGKLTAEGGIESWGTSTLGPTSTTTLSASTITGSGAADFGSTVNVTGKLTAEGGIESWGTSTLGATSTTTFSASTITGSGAADFGSTVNVTGKLTAESSFECWGPAAMGATSVTTLDTSSTATVGSDLTVNGNAVIGEITDSATTLSLYTTQTGISTIKFVGNTSVESDTYGLIKYDQDYGGTRILSMGYDGRENFKLSGYTTSVNFEHFGTVYWRPNGYNDPNRLNGGSGVSNVYHRWFGNAEDVNYFMRHEVKFSYNNGTELPEYWSHRYGYNSWILYWGAGETGSSARMYFTSWYTRFALDGNTMLNMDNSQITIGTTTLARPVLIQTAADATKDFSFNTDGSFTVEYGPLYLGSTTFSSAELRLRTSSTGLASIAFNDGSTAASIYYDHSINQFTHQIGGVYVMRASASQITIGDTSLARAIYFHSGGAGNSAYFSSGGALFVDQGSAYLGVSGTTAASNLYIRTTTTGTGAVVFSDGSQSGAVTYTHTDNVMTFKTGGSDRVTIDSTGDVNLATGDLSLSTGSVTVTAGDVSIGSTSDLLPIVSLTSSSSGVGTIQFLANTKTTFVHQYLGASETYTMWWNSASYPSITMAKSANTITFDGTVIMADTYVPPTMTTACTTGTKSWGLFSGNYYEYLCVATNTWRRSAAYTTF